MIKDKKELIKLIIVFVLEVLITLGVSFGAGRIMTATGMEYSIFAVTLVLDTLLILVTLIYTFKKGDRFLEAYKIKGIKVSTFFWVLLLTIVASPMYIFANVVSQLFVPNVMIQNLDTLFSGSTLLSVIGIAVIAPIGEELVMRGFFQNRFKKIMPFAAAAILSGFLFGVLHLNFNQFCYAWVLGVLFAYTNRASGSTLTSIFMHMFINGGNSLLMLFMKWAVEVSGMTASDIANQSEATRADSSTMITMAVVFGVLAIGSFFLSRLIIRAIAKNEGTVIE
ncbi:Membrane protease YdiL, CAAX protease family [Pseudobutyrivibrio sp. YE44]|uniref:CPBP family intramembrane glutamic endopeptidase n=1 Tax=Pseudobutyrivibrio sp. YE44 TaxID=1520802 RepID=UPI0008915A01|nr:type II CAAX endopeptidase family protein [Pseudobutyrivibrio sp. YE44]SDB31268.1 Membrane protease YdiL, CAAX protease family [Pseudobutyrivibrio sp. YE44]